MQRLHPRYVHIILVSSRIAIQKDLFGVRGAAFGRARKSRALLRQRDSELVLLSPSYNFGFRVLTISQISRYQVNRLRKSFVYRIGRVFTTGCD